VVGRVLGLGGHDAEVISVPSGPSSFVDLLGPPMEAGGRADAVGLVLEGSAAGELGVFQVLDHGEVLVDQRGVGERPHMLGRL
jgi:hypothetical protein